MPSPSAEAAVDVAAVRAYLLALQSRIVATLEAADGGTFASDGWVRPADGRLTGDGLTRLIEGGALVERGGCNFSHVAGQTLPPSATAARPELAGAAFEALGVSLVFHPRNPYVPTVHMNVRLFVATPKEGAPVFWFGGGMDLTPYYGFEDDARHFHATCRDALAPFGDALYPRFKAWCDEYFFLKHRNEPRGIGGIFFDDVAEPGFDQGFAMLRAVGDAFLAAYLPIVERRRALPYGERERDFQAYRRGRYVEFNLVWDRGTLFGLQSGGRTEAILMSMPPLASWRYRWAPEDGTPEARLYTDFLRPRDWITPLTNITRSAGLFGGSFDPPHLAHRALADAALAQLPLDALVWLPARQSPHKAERMPASGADRVAMLQRMTEGEPRFSIDARELDRAGPSYTVDTLRELHVEQPGTRWWLVIGQDQYARFDIWHDWREILALAGLAVAARDGDAVRAAPGLSGIPHALRIVEMPALPHSATTVRARAAAGLDVTALVGAPVARYIADHNVYTPSK